MVQADVIMSVQACRSDYLSAHTIPLFRVPNLMVIGPY